MVNIWRLVYIIIVLGIIAGAVYEIKTSYFPDSVCECRELNFGTNSDSQTRFCVYHYILNSKSYTDCSYFGVVCAGYLENNGVDCDNVDCGTSSIRQMENKADEYIELHENFSKALDNQDYKKALEYSTRMDNYTMKYPTIEEMSEKINSTGMRAYFRDKGCR